MGTFWFVQIMKIYHVLFEQRTLQDFHYVSQTHAFAAIFKVFSLEKVSISPQFHLPTNNITLLIFSFEGIDIMFANDSSSLYFIGCKCYISPDALMVDQ